MAVVSVTRLHLRSLRFFPAFAWHTWAITRQTRAAPGFVEGQFANEWPYAFWTVTAWRDLGAMRAFRDSGAHHRAMKLLLHWCDEASFVHWDAADGAVPPIGEAHARLLSTGRTSKVNHPSAAHLAGQCASTRVPVVSATIKPTGLQH